MKIQLKLLLSPFILIVGIYAATPVWLPWMFAAQLPPGWQLERLDAGYPGFSGIDISSLQVQGGLLAADMELTAADIRFSYRGLKTEIGSLTLEVFLQAAEDDEAETLSLDDLSLPITKLTGRLPELSVGQLRVDLHPAVNNSSAIALVTHPLVLDFKAFKLRPRNNTEYDFSTSAGIAGAPGINGQLDVDITANSRKARIRFPAASDSPAWLVISLEQQERALQTTTRIQAVFDAGPADRQWLDSLLARSTGGMLTHVGGNLEVQADFAGKELQDIERLSLATDQLLTEFDGGSLTFDAELLASREGEKVTVTLPGPAKIHYQDKAGNIDGLFTRFVPDLQRTAQPLATALAELDATTRLVIQTGADSSIEFGGDIKLGLTSAERGISLQSAGLQIEVGDLSSLDSTTATGLITLNWTENTPIAYTTDDLYLQADKLSVSTELALRNGRFISAGSGIFWQGRIKSPAASAAKVDVSWQELDILKLAGKLETRTQGFATEFDGEILTGFDFDIAYTLSGNTDVDGSGTLKVNAGPGLPIEFVGNLLAGQWNVKLPLSTIKLTQLGNLLRVANFELPAAVKLTNGFIDFEANVAIAEQITATMTINGYELGGSMLESSARNASFSFNSAYGNTISVSGPAFIGSATLAGDIKVANVRADFSSDNLVTFGLKNLYGEVFDGQLKVESLQFSENSFEDTTLELKDIKLGRLLAYVDIDGLEGTGELDISLPAGSDQAGIFIKNGAFKSTGPGRLAYTKEGVTAGNIGLQALENFHYQVFSGTINYQSDGAYLIVIHLEGNNPDLYGGQSIVFNLNINGSLPEIFRALFVTGSWEEAILKQIKAK